MVTSPTATPGQTESPADKCYPPKLALSELSLLLARREVAQVPEEAPLIGLALSGGGIRSATFALGVLQGMARRRFLRRIDFLSTVSGGSFVGSFFGALVSRGDKAHEADAKTGIDLAEKLLAKPSRVVSWLKENGRYLAPNGAGDLLAGAADAARSWLTVQILLVIGLLIPLSTLAILEYRVAPYSAVLAAYLHLPAAVGGDPFFPAVIFMAAVVPPFFLAYWLITDWKQPAVDFGLWTLVAVLTWRAFDAGWHPFVQIALGGAMALAILLCVVTPSEHKNNLFSRDVGLRRSTGWISRIVLVVAAAAALTAAAWLGRQDWGPRLDTLRGPAAVYGGIVGLGLALGRVLARYVPVLREGIGRNLAAALGVGLWVLIPISLASTMAHDTFAHGGARWWYVGLLAAFVTLGKNVRLLNGATLHPMYRERLSRAYLGASNVARVSTDQKHPPVDLTKPLEDDDFAFEYYAPHLEGGPLHVINLTLNETRSGRSSIEQRDRKGLAFAVGPAGLSVSGNSHALWNQKQGKPSLIEKAQSKFDSIAGQLKLAPRAAEARPKWIKAAGPEQAYHALFAKAPYEDHPVEGLTLGGWTAISGAAVSTGLGHQTSLVTSLLCTLANLRLGYWWKSHVRPGDRRNIADTRLARWFSAAVPVFAHLSHEMLARFYGPNRLRWYLTDGGHFENTGAFELLRRRLPLIIISDCGMDPDYSFADLANLTRKGRDDLRAEIRVMTSGELDAMFGQHKKLRSLFGTIEEFRQENHAVPLGGARHQAHALLAWVFYDGAGDEHPTGDDARKKSGSVILIIKPSITGDEPVDVLNYRQEKTMFPQQSTGEQFFNEAQWESYRKLGDHITEELFAAGLGPFLDDKPFNGVSLTKPAKPVRRRGRAA